MKNLFKILTFVFANAIICQPLYSEDSYKSAMNVIHNYSRIIRKEKGIICTSYGLDYAGPDKIYDEKIHAIAIGYKIDKQMKYEEARKLFYEVVDGLLDYLNKNEKIRKNFFHFPLTYEDLDFHFSFDYDEKGFLRVDDVDSIHISGNKITYFIVKKEDIPKKENKEFSSDVFVGYLSKYRAIMKPLPEKD